MRRLGSEQAWIYAVRIGTKGLSIQLFVYIRVRKSLSARIAPCGDFISALFV